MLPGVSQISAPTSPSNTHRVTRGWQVSRQCAICGFVIGAARHHAADHRGGGTHIDVGSCGGAVQLAMVSVSLQVSAGVEWALHGRAGSGACSVSTVALA